MAIIFYTYLVSKVHDEVSTWRESILYFYYVKPRDQLKSSSGLVENDSICWAILPAIHSNI